jgi:hypothetical protein
MRYIRKLQNVNPHDGDGRHMTVSIPSTMNDVFVTDTVIIEPLPGRRGVTIKPARVEPIEN